MTGMVWYGRTKVNYGVLTSSSESANLNMLLMVLTNFLVTLCLKLKLKETASRTLFVRFMVSVRTA